MIKNYLKILVALVFATNVIAQNVPSYVPKDGLVGWWPFNGNANDESGNGNHGTVNGATLTSDRFGNQSNSYEFSASNQNYIGTGFNISPSTTITISSWINFYGAIGGGNPLHALDWYSIVDGLLLNANPNSKLFNKVIFNITNQPSSTEIIQLNKWQNIVGVIDANGNCSFYLNGILTGQGQLTGSYSVSSAVYNFIGKSSNSAWYFNGKIDDVGIWNRTLSEQEIKQLYEGCTKETATSSNFNSVIYTTNNPLNLTASPLGGIFSGVAVENNSFNPSKAKLGKNQVKYTFKNSTGCADSTNFEMIMVDTLGNKCTETIYDTIKVKESTYDTLKIKVQLTTGINAGQVAKMNVYPNPTSDVVIIETSDVAALNGYSYKMVDLQGKQVYKELVTKSKTEISLKNIGAKGVYILHVLDAQGVSIENKKIVLE